MNDRRRLEQVRREQTDVVNHVIDEYFAGHITRRSFVQRASVLGLSTGLVGFLAACGSSKTKGSPTTTGGGSSASTAAGATTSAGGSGGGSGQSGLGTLKVGGPGPTASIDPVKVADLGGLIVLYQVGDYLTFDGPDLVLKPGIATKWTPNADGTEWTFTIRDGVKFQDGTPLTADDVAATFNRLTDPAQKSAALSVFKGVLSKDNTTAKDASTVVFKLDAPNGNFPYLVSSDNYNAIILKKDYAGDFEQKPIGTGPWKLDKYTPKVGATYSKNPDYWGEKAHFDKVEFTFYADEASEVQALQSGAVDVAHSVSASGGKPLEGKFDVVNIPTTAHRQVHMRTDMDPFKDNRTRQAIALLLDRPAIVQGLFDGYAVVGNDSPFAPVYPSTDKSVAQRTKDLTKAKQLLQAAGEQNLKATINAIKVAEVPDYAVIIQNAAKEIGVDLGVTVQDSATFYGDAVYGKSPWLDAVMGIVDYGHRGVPNVFLGAPLLSDGTWNSAHFKNPTYDGLVKSYYGALDLDSQRKYAKQIQELLLDQTPIIFSYFYNYLSYVKKGIKNIGITGMGQISLNTATKG